MQQRMTTAKRGAISLIAACSLAMGLTLAPTSAFAQEQTVEDESFQVVEGIEENDVEEALVTDELGVPEDGPSVDTPAGDTLPDSVAIDSIVDEVVSDVVDDEAEADTSLTDEQQEATTVTGDEPAAEEEALAVEAVEQAPVEEAVEQALPGETDDAATTDDQTGEEDSLLVLSDPGVEIAEGDYIIEAGIASEDKTGLASLVLDARGSAYEGTRIISWRYTGKDNQKWHIAGDGSGWYVISAYTDNSLVLTATNDSGKLYLTKYVSGLASQLWQFILSGTSYGTGYQISPQGIQKSATNRTIVSTLPAKAVDVRGNTTDNGADIITYSRSDTVKGNQTYYLVNANPETPTSGLKDMEGKYRVKVPNNTSVVIEIYKESTDNGANVWLYSNNGKAHQDVYLQHEGNGFYSIWIMGTKKVLDVRGSSILPGTNIIQWDYKGSDNQLWAIRKNSNGTYTFVNKATGLALGVASETKGAKGNNIAGAQDNERANNKFTLTRSALISGGIYKIKGVSDSKVLDVSKSSTSSGASLSFYTDNGGNNQRFELVSAGGTDLWRIRTASSGGWVNYVSGSGVTQEGNHATAITDNNTWQVVWRKGNYMLKSKVNGHVLGGGQKQVTFVSAPITLKEGLFEIDAKLSGVVLDIPGSSTSSGVKVNVYPDKNGENQKFIIQSYGTGYKIVSTVSGLAITASGTSNGSSVVQSKFTGAATQVWTVGIADGGYVRLINKSTKGALDVSGSGSSIDNTKSTATRVYTSTGDREARQSWKINVTKGWYKIDGHWRYQRTDFKGKFDNDITGGGKDLGHYDVIHDVWEKIKGYKSNTKYLIGSSWDSCYVVVFTGSWNNWDPLYGWNCANGSASVIEGKVREENPESTWTWNPSWDKYLAAANVKSRMPELPEENAWAAKLGNTWETSRVRKVNSGEQFFTSISWTLGYHTYLKSKSELGRHISNGCQRLAYANAEWIYNNIGPGTRCLQIRTKAYS